MLSGICGEPRYAQIGRITEQLGELFARRRPAAVVVQGDTNTAMAAAQAGDCCGVPVVHVEAGLRSYDRDMPEEINRCVIGVLASVHCAPTPRQRPAWPPRMPAARIALTGNTIVEATLAMLPGEGQAREIAAASGAEPGRYVLATIHRPENTDDPRRLGTILDELGKLGLPVLFPLHPRTRPWRWPGTAWAQRSTGCGCSRRPTTGPSWAWPGTPGCWSPTPAACRKSARCSSDR